MSIDGSEQQEGSLSDEDALKQMDEEEEEGEKETLSTGLSRQALSNRSRLSEQFIFAVESFGKKAAIDPMLGKMEETERLQGHSYER